MATNDRDDRLDKISKRVAAARVRMVRTGIDNSQLAQFAGSEADIVALERELGGRITGGEGAGPARK